MSAIVYSAQESGFEPGLTYRNPRYFQSPLGKPEKVIVVGSWPNVVAAYEALGVPVEAVAHGTPLRVPGKIAPPSKPKEGQNGDPDANRAAGDTPNPKGEPVEIPADWASWHWSQQEKLAALIVGTTTPLETAEGQTRAQKAAAIINAELSERASTAAAS